MPLLGCLAPGTPEVGGYLDDPDMMPNNEKVAQFRISDTRMPRETFERVEANTEFNILDFVSEDNRAERELVANH